MTTPIISDVDLLARELCDQAARREALERRIADLEAERDMYREIARQAVHALAELYTRYERQRAHYHALLDERRAERLGRAA